MMLTVLILLWAAVLVLAVIAGMRGRILLHDGIRRGFADFLRVLPRLAIGTLGSGYLAALLPQEFVTQWFGPDSGIFGLTVATLAGALTPGGPVIGYALGVAALKGGAGAPQVVAYSTAWALYAFPRLLAWELPMMPARIVWLRVIVSLPMPFLAGAAAMLVGKP